MFTGKRISEPGRKIVSMVRALLSIFAGAIMELFVFVSRIPENSTKPLNLWQVALGHIVGPAIWIAGRFGPLPENLPGPMSMIREVLVLGLAFLIQAAIFAVPVWICLFSISLASRRQH
jgi:hypothetical protein